jgi:predicted DCC family thiol-disulfide oxidoreductase YuxK
MTDSTAIILFDGVCAWCNASVNWLIKHDKAGRLKFAPLQSPAGQALLKQYNLPADFMDSMVFIENDVAHTYSTANLRTTAYLGWPWKMGAWLQIVPRFLRDGVYKFIARNRYKIMGKRESCVLPTPEYRARFIEGAL